MIFAVREHDDTLGLNWIACNSYYFKEVLSCRKNGRSHTY